MASRRTQPQRRSAKRRQTAALRAAQAGKPAYMNNPMDPRRKALRKRRRRSRKGSNPLYRILGVRRKGNTRV